MRPAGILLQLLLLTTALLVACSDESAPATPSAETAGPTATAEIVVASTAAAESRPPGALLLWHAYGAGSSEEVALFEVLGKARQNNPALAIDVMQFPADRIFDQWRTAVEVDSGPDLLLAPNDTLPALARSGALLDLTDRLQAQLSDVSAIGIAGMTVDGRLYGVPQSADLVALYYDRTRVPQPPATTDALLAAQQAGQTFGSVVNAYFLHGFIPAFNGKVIDETGTVACPQQDGIVAAFEHLVDLKNSGAFYDREYGRVEEVFLEQNVVQFVNGPWALAQYETELGDALGVAPLPAAQAPSGPLVNVDGIYLNPNSGAVDDAVALALAMTDAASAEIWANVANHVPVRDDVIPADPLLQAFSAALATAQPVPTTSGFDAYWDIFDDALNQVLRGTSDSADVVAQACTAFQTELDGG